MTKHVEPGERERIPLSAALQRLITEVSAGVAQRLASPAASAQGGGHLLASRVASTADRALRRTLSETLTRDTLGVFVITGDIPAMWLRDSTTQLMPYLRLVRDSPDLAGLVAGVLQRQLWMLEHDSYANAFNAEPSGASYEPGDLHADPWVWEQKYEIDSIAFPLALAHRFWRETGRDDHLDARFREVAHSLLEQIALEQHHEERSTYRFVRPGVLATETLERDGLGTPVGFTGMTWSGFRPSDDACTYGYNVPGNLMLAQSLLGLAEMADDVWHDAPLAGRARDLSRELVTGVSAHGITEHPRYGRVYAYEVDGLGGRVLMDDANMPSLLSLPLLAPDVIDAEVMAATRSFVLSAANPWFFSGTAAEGIGSPHTGPEKIWPIALAVQGLTTTDLAERFRLLEVLLDTDGGTGSMHESFHRDDPTRYSRAWFSWADSMFCELALQTAAQAGTSSR